MNISMNKLLTKMEAELRLAKSAQTEAVQREKIHSIKTLCELVLDEPTTASKKEQQQTQLFNPQQQIISQPVQQPSQMMPQPKKLELEDEANGDSLLDF